jgi:TRAP-type C4-dicarboxylate transport system permease large subunit
VPGLMMAIALMIAWAWIARRRDLPPGERVSARQALCHLARAFLPITLPALLLGGIYSGAFSPTEAAAVAAFYAMLLSAFVYHTLDGKVLYAVSAWIKRMDLSPLAFMLMINVLFIVLGCLIDTGTLLLVLVPVLLPTVRALGIDLVYFGVVIIVNLMIGLVTPPFGMVLFVMTALTKARLGEVSREILIFAAALIVALFVMVLVPGTITWLPRFFGYTG